MRVLRARGVEGDIQRDVDRRKCRGRLMRALLARLTHCVVVVEQRVVTCINESCHVRISRVMPCVLQCVAVCKIDALSCACSTCDCSANVSCGISRSHVTYDEVVCCSVLQCFAVVT